ncbi:SpoIIE family protein phosphatase [Streptomyces sp. NPDC007851]|uniref:SpoIIE family protein phosphatase n=1 Tax=Streptomyces sp. NPDC007851 TaxID=3155008 RepID=UPI0033E9016D
MRWPAGDSGPARFRERFLQGEPVGSGVRAPILDSWLRCRSLGISPDRADLPFRADFDPGGRIVRAAAPVLDRLQARFAGSRINISLADANGIVLLRRFGDPAMARVLPAIQVEPGFVFAERFAGTNGIGLALAERTLVRVFGAEHFAERAQGNACIASPVRDPLSGRMEGVLCFGYHRSVEDPALAGIIRRAVGAVEDRLLRQSSARERVLLRAYESTAGLGRGLCVDEPVLDLRPGDRVILIEKAAELISHGRHAVAGVSLSDGRRVTLVSRLVTSTSGVQGLAVEMLLPGLAAGTSLDVSHHRVRLDGPATVLGPAACEGGPGTPSDPVAGDPLHAITGHATLPGTPPAPVPTRTAPPRPGPARAGSADPGPTRSAPPAPVPTRSAPPRPGPARAGSAAPGPTPTPPPRTGPARAGSADPGATRSALPRRDPARAGSADPGPTPTPPPRTGPARAGSADPGSTRIAPARTGPARSAPPRAGSGDPGRSPGGRARGPAPPAAPARPSLRTTSPPLRPAPDPVVPESSGGPRRLVLFGEPEVGAYALAARRRLELLSEASTRIGTTLDVRRTAEELALTAVPELADFVTVDLPDAVLRGEEADDPLGDLRRTVVHGVRDGLPFTPVGKRIDFGPATPQLRCLTHGRAELEPDLQVAAGWLAQDPEHTEGLLAHVHSLVAVPLVARGVVLGIASFYRGQGSAAFGDDDRSLAQELATRAALSIDNARRYTHERSMVLALQRRLLPHGLPDQDAVEIAHRYLPAEADVGGDWYDVIPLSGTRIGLLVGDVVGHGMLSAATMGRLRTAARSFAELDFPPDEVLTHLDNLVGRLDRDDPDGEGSGIIGATCLYAVYDPTTQRCVMARAGHPPPALVRPDGSVSYPDLPAGPPLGLGGLPFDAVELDLPEDSRLILYTDGLIEDRHRDVDAVLEQLRGALADRPERTPEETCRDILDRVAPAHPCDDIALLVVRTHALAPGRMAAWELDPDPAVVGEIRAAALAKLAEWGLDEAAFAMELILSELVTNAIRHGSGPVRVRLLHHRSLICEVLDSSNTAPHLRRAAGTDEGGRGLFLVAQLARAWGTRHLSEGKVIWAECGVDGV